MRPLSAAMTAPGRLLPTRSAGDAADARRSVFAARARAAPALRSYAAELTDGSTTAALAALADGAPVEDTLDLFIRFIDEVPPAPLPRLQPRAAALAPASSDGAAPAAAAAPQSPQSPQPVMELEPAPSADEESAAQLAQAIAMSLMEA
jgi:hypothetical protein